MPSNPPDDRRYLETHEWHKLDGNTVTIGVTQIAADELTDVTFVDLPKVGTKLEANGRFGEIESVKATSDLYSGGTGPARRAGPLFRNRRPVRHLQGWHG